MNGIALLSSTGSPVNSANVTCNGRQRMKIIIIFDTGDWMANRTRKFEMKQSVTTMTCNAMLCLFSSYFAKTSKTL